MACEPHESARRAADANAGLESDARWSRVALVGGRCALASLFVLGGIAKLLAPELYLEMMRDASLEPANVLLPLVAALELGGGLAIAFGLRIGVWAAIVLAAHTLATNVFLHRFWTFEEPIRRLELSAFFKNLSIAGGLVFYAAATASRRRGEGGRAVPASFVSERSTESRER